MSLLASAVLVFLAYCLLLLHGCMCMGSEGAGTGSVFDQGVHAVSLSRLDEASRAPPSRCPAARPRQPDAAIPLPPKPLLVAAPREAGEYPVLLFLHGYLAANSFYSQLLEHVASHGFVVVAPQLYTVSGADTTDEINAAARVIDWLAATAGGGLGLPLGVRADLTKVSVSGHSRGGKVAFALALGLGLGLADHKALPLAALVAVDPVDGMGVGRQTPPPVLTGGENASLQVGVPALVIGTGLGELPGGPLGLLPPCAPRGVSHAAFYDELADDGGAAAAPKCHMVARDYGHTDMMDDETPGARGLLTRAVCRSGGARKPMRRFVAGATVAFLNRWVGGDAAALDGIRERPDQAPVALSVVEFQDQKGIAYRL